MGCDIHVHYEVRTPDGVWAVVPVRDKYKVSTASAGTEDEYDEIDYDGLFADPLYLGRNYDLFAVLADVRNGRGFAGNVTGERIIPASAPRGLPPDATPEARTESDGWGADGHSHSWLLLSELALKYDWTRGRKVSGKVTKGQFVKYLENGRPDDWFGHMSGYGTREIGNPQMHQRVKDKTPDNGVTYFTRVEWVDRIADSCRHFVDRTIPAMCRLVIPDAAWPEVEPLVRAIDNGPPLPLPDKLQDLGLPPDLLDRVRMVFWFDN